LSGTDLIAADGSVLPAPDDWFGVGDDWHGRLPDTPDGKSVQLTGAAAGAVGRYGAVDEWRCPRCGAMLFLPWCVACAARSQRLYGRRLPSGADADADVLALSPAIAAACRLVRDVGWLGDDGRRRQPWTQAIREKRLRGAESSP